ncbi:hypothetical protein E5288_WYG021297 [Bos mutus]|uniref:Phosphatidylinositol 5-phosphate 4-kinase type-2 alpha n=1 Tax=Bos mutus TaxID=72004 RepID=A0A6B0RFZ4_9CETA|nr:hypothetical protein [Bos mutus]
MPENVLSQQPLPEHHQLNCAEDRESTAEQSETPMCRRVHFKHLASQTQFCLTVLCSSSHVAALRTERVNHGKSKQNSMNRAGKSPRGRPGHWERCLITQHQRNPLPGPFAGAFLLLNSEICICRLLGVETTGKRASDTEPLDFTIKEEDISECNSGLLKLSIYGIAIKQKEKYNCFVKILMQPNDDKPLSASFQIGYIEWLDQINELSHVQIPVMLMPDDFKAYSKIKVDNHLFNKENMPSHFKFKEYCPMVFRNLRERFGIDDQDFQNSLTRSAPLPNDSQARSGARFHTSYDKRYIIKTITSEDVAEMHNILKKYHQYIVECHGITLLPQFLGMYRLNVDGVEIYVIVTRNVFSHRLSVYRKYDLKGSTVAREASDKEKAKELPTLKDNDFINEGQKIYIDDNNKKVFLEKLKKDVEFLAQLKLMDYSLLVGIHDRELGTESLAVSWGCTRLSHSPCCLCFQTLNPSPLPHSSANCPRRCHHLSHNPVSHPFADSPRKEVYFMAIIDILTHYDAKKKAAHAAKTVKHGAGAEISTVNPEQYSKRFLDFIGHILT